MQGDCHNSFRGDIFMSSAWIYQDPKQLKRYGSERASWYVGWFDPEGKKRCRSCGAGTRGKNSAQKLRDKRQAELIEGTYRKDAKKTWKEFRAEYDARFLVGMKPNTRRLTCESLKHFEDLIKPVKLAAIRTQTIDDFIALRRAMKGKQEGSTVSPASVNKDLRHLKAVLRVANDWGYLPTVPKFRMLKEPGKLPTYITPKHFAAIYGKCDQATMPTLPGIDAADWWHGLLTMAYMTGWRIGELLALRREDVNLDAGTALTRARTTRVAGTRW
jgi:integrase